MTVPLSIVLELNQKHGKGYQVAVCYGATCYRYDADPLTLYDACACAAVAVEEINKAFGTSYKLHEVMQITTPALEGNARRDLASAKLLKQSKQSLPDVRIDAQGQPLLSARGVVLLSWFSWFDDEKLPRVEECLRRYCAYIAMHGAGAASTLFAELMRQDKDAGAAWIQRTYAQYIHDSGRGVVAYILNQ